ncbi:MAG: (2Fe-2S) ferredoxin domain-containing protein [Pseudomonadota bacterium]
MSYYQHHVFCCLNERKPEEECCAHLGAQRLFDYAKAQIKNLGLSGEGKIRLNRAGCLDRCEYGPVWVVYPEEVWYTIIDEHDVDEIISSHLQNGIPVERLRVPQR